MSLPGPHVLVFGAGAVGCSVGGWLAQVGASVTFLARGAAAEALRVRGLTLYRAGAPAERWTFPVPVVASLGEGPRPDIVVLAVKNYSLESAARQVYEVLGDAAVVVGLQNGVENQAVLPRFFQGVVYGVVHYNAWLDAPGVVGYQRKGPLVLGTAGGRPEGDLATVTRLFAPAVETVATDRLQDAVHSKLVINLANSLTTLVGYPGRELTDPGLFQRLLSNLAYEGVRSMEAAGYREFKVKGAPTWLLMRAAATLPQFLTRGAFERNVRKMVMSSMAQDVLQRGGSDSELESINGRLIELADRHGLGVPYNRAVYALCRDRFARTPFEPMDVNDVWAEVRKRL